MQVKDLELFVAIKNEKSITKAAERLYMAQSTASRRIVEMESELGHPLLYRSTHGLTVTAQGKKVYLHAQKVLEEYSKLLESLGDAPIPRLSIGFNPIAGEPRYLSAALQKMLRKKPSLHVVLICEPTPKLYPKLKKGELDCLIASRDFVRDPSLFKRYTVDSIHYFAMVSSHHPLCKKESVVMRELADQRLLTISHEGAPIMSDSVRRILREKDISTPVFDHFDSVESLVTAVQAEMGVRIISSDAHARPNCIPVLIRDIEVKASRQMIWLKDNLNPAISLLLKALDEVKKDRKSKTA